MSAREPREGAVSVEELTSWAHRAAVEHLEACQEALYEEDEDLEVESPAVGPYCGCTDCEVREILHAAWPMLARAAVLLHQQDQAESESPTSDG